MSEAERREELGKSLVITWIIWAAMLGSLAIYVLICHLLGNEIRSGIKPEDMPVELIKNVLIVISAAEIVMAYFLRRFMLKPRSGAEMVSDREERLSQLSRIKERYTAAVLISLAISESVGIYGLVLFLLGQEFATLYTFIAISAMAMIFYRPNPDEFAQFAGVSVNN